jgi:DNA-binding response OmpR family regulator
MRATCGRETILVVDDEQQLRTDLCRILRQEGYVAIPTGRGPEAHWCVEQHGERVDLLIAALAAPEADAYHLGIPIGRLFPLTTALFISPGAREEHVRRGLLHPGTPFLRTPFPPRALTRTVRVLLDRRKSMRLM